MRNLIHHRFPRLAAIIVGMLAMLILADPAFAQRLAVPGEPTGLTATADGKTKMELLWTAPEDSGSSSLTGYKIEHLVSEASAWADLVMNTETQSNGQNQGDSRVETSYVVTTNLTAGTTRHYRVSAINSEGESDPSESAMATTALTPSLGAHDGLDGDGERRDRDRVVVG